MGKLNAETRTIYCKDNLDILEGINDECIDLIYLDPPFNKKKTFTAPIGSSAEGAKFKDIFKKEDVKDEWADTIKQDNPELYHLLMGIKTFSNSYNYCYSVYMAIRLIEMHRVLKDTGSIYLHCDHTMSHYLKLVMDCIFGEKQFRNEIIWCYEGPSSPGMTSWANKSDVVFLYNKIKGRNTWNVDDVREQYSENSLSSFSSPSRYGERSKYASLGKYPKNWWIDISSLKNTKERLGYPTQKPLALLKRIIAASSNLDDIVLDPFCGCATTCVAAEALQRQWIGIDVSIKAYELVKMRLEREIPSETIGEPKYTTTPPKRMDNGRDKKF